MKKIRIGILGFANIAKKAIIPAAIESKYFELFGIASRDNSNKKIIEEDYCCRYFEEYEKMVEDPNIDALHIPLPNSLHYHWARLALQNEKHILVEKSLACSLKDVRALNEMAKKRNLTVLENFQFRKHSQLSKIKDILATKELGNIRAIKSSFGFPPFPNKNNIRYKKNLGGGALLDAGAYPVKVAQELLGYDLKITSALLNYEDSDVDIWGAGMIEDNTSANFVQFSFGFDNYYQCSLEIWGSKGKLFTNRIFTAPPNYKAVLSVENKKETKEILVEPDNSYVNMLNYFYDCIIDDELKAFEYETNINQARLLEDFYVFAHK